MKYGKPYTTILQIFALITPFLWYWRESHEILWHVSWYTVFVLMLIRPVSELFPQHKWIKRLMPYRKELGILSAAVVVTSAFYRYIPMGTDFFGYYFSFSFWDFRTPAAFGHLAELVGLILLITSNKFSMRRMKKWWKRVQKTSYIYYYGAAILLISYGKMDVLVTALFTLVIATIAAIKKRVKSR